MTHDQVRKLLSVQSHVVHGYVGNKAATFPLQCQGWDIDALNTVNFSNHTGYGSFKGTQTSAEEIRELYRGLQDIDVRYDAFLTGYTTGAEALEAVGDIGLDLKERNSGCLWLLDPVMGDEGQLYVSEGVIPIYQKLLMKGGIDVITPNQFEAELLVGYKIDSIDSLKKALNDLHIKFHVPNVVISSMNFNQGEAQITKLITVSSSLSEGKIYSYMFKVPYIQSYFTGVGDLFSALLLDRVYTFRQDGQIRSEELLSQAVNEVLSIMSQVLKVTSAAAQNVLGTDVKSQMGSSRTMKECELKLVASRGLYGSTEKLFTPVDLSEKSLLL